MVVVVLFVVVGIIFLMNGNYPINPAPYFCLNFSEADLLK